MFFVQLQLKVIALVKLFIAAKKGKNACRFCHSTGMPCGFLAWDYRHPTYGFRSPLRRAVASGQVKIVKLLVNVGASLSDPSVKSDASRGVLDTSVLSDAVLANNKEMVELLLSHFCANGEVETRLPCHMPSIKRCFEYSIGHGNLGLVKLFLYDFDFGFHVNKIINCNCGKFTPLMVAAYHGQTDMVHYLLSQGADVNIRSKKDVGRGETATMLAERNGHTEIAAVLRSNESSCLIS